MKIENHNGKKWFCFCFSSEFLEQVRLNYTSGGEFNHKHDFMKKLFQVQVKTRKRSTSFYVFKTEFISGTTFKILLTILNIVSKLNDKFYYIMESILLVQLPMKQIRNNFEVFC